MTRKKAIRKFASGATRNTSDDKLDFEGFLSPAVLIRFAEYMHKHRTQADGQIRDSDNWQKGIPRSAYMKSKMRHTIDMWAMHRGIQRYDRDDGHPYSLQELCCADAFNTMGYLLELIRSGEGNTPLNDTQ